MRTHSFSLAMALSVLCASSVAGATVTEPNGLVVPLDSMNGETQLYSMFSSRGESVDWRTDAAQMPAVFSPLCSFRATFVLKQSGSMYGVGWYNADATSSPGPSDIHIIVPAGSPVGSMISSLNIRSDPAWHGGAIGFALVGGQTHYSESRWELVCSSCSSPGPWIMAVIYRSSVTPNAYYVAFEDGSVGDGNGGYGNDGDYNDYVFFFEGLQCMGGGVPCDTGMQGICAQGVTQCGASGVSCMPVVTAATESCNGVDDDCNGMVDDGMNLCPVGQVCDRGTCVNHCLEGSCFTGQVCTDRGTCQDSACATVTCPSGQVCTAGNCHAPCDGVVCPGNQTCRAGRCVDPCAGVTCPSGQVCTNGACVTSCVCSVCGAGMTCNMTSGLCGDPGCATTTCATGTVCRAGSCVDPCDGAMCPTGQNCVSGSCVDAPPDAGMGTDASVSDGGGTMRDAGTPRDGSATDAGRRDATSDGSLRGTDAGCACRAPRSRSRRGAWTALSILAIATASRRRRQSRKNRPVPVD